jgi:hypothetical protein
MTARTLAAATVLAAVLAGCGSTHSTAIWRDPNAKGTAFKKILVGAMGVDTNARRTVEDALVARLPKGSAVASYSVLPEGQERDVERLRALLAEGYDGVLVVRLLEVGQELQRDTTTTATNVYGYWGYSATAMYSNRTLDLAKVVRVESKLFDLAKQEPVWSMETETMDPQDRAQTVESFVDFLVKKLSSDGLLAK